jgi:hypothetical protein
MFTTTKEYPILFTGEMVRAILEGRKTATRRVINVRRGVRVEDVADFTMSPPSLYQDYGYYISLEDGDTVIKPQSPYGQVGDTLYVRENWQANPQPEGDFGNWWHEVPREFRGYETCLHLLFQADKKQYQAMQFGEFSYLDPTNHTVDSLPPKWLPSIHMPKWASRIKLLVKSVKAERVQDIKNYQAVEEGVDATGIYTDQSARANFARLWDKINAKRGYSWDSNPWVWAVDFEVLSKSESAQ